MKILTVVGTRPEIIRLSRVISLLDKHVNHVLVHTGQNYDYELNEIFFQQLELRRPNHFLNVNTSSLGSAIGDIFLKTEEVLKLEKPDALLVLGDTNSCLSAYMAKRMHIPVFHMEAGNRCYDFNVPEEVNRRIIDHIADYNLVYTEHARRHLISEGLPHRRIYLTGSPMKEVLDYYKPKIDQSDIFEQLAPLFNELGEETTNPKLKTRKYFLVSVHREENVDNPANLRKILTILNTLAEKYNHPVIVSTHPRTRKRLEQVTDMPVNKKVAFLKPFGFLDYVQLQQHALCTLSDSGTISEESAILSFPAISLRQSMERPEAQDAGTIVLTGFDPQTVLNSIDIVMTEHKDRHYHNNVADYSITDTSWRVLKLILGLSSLSNKWHGIPEKE